MKLKDHCKLWPPSPPVRRKTDKYSPTPGLDNDAILRDVSDDPEDPDVITLHVAQAVQLQDLRLEAFLKDRSIRKPVCEFLKAHRGKPLGEIGELVVK